jgi:hypothetical protein
MATNQPTARLTNTRQFLDALGTALENFDPDFVEMEVSRVRSFADAGLMTRDKGLVVTLADGTVWQLTVQQDRRHGAVDEVEDDEEDEDN